MYLISRDGFTFLVMGFTGDKAFQFKKAYIKRFNEMEAIINKRTLPPPKQENPFNPNMSALDIMKLTIQAFEEQKTEMIGLIQNQVSSVKEELKSEIKNEVQELKSEIELKEQAKKEQELKEKEDLLKSMQEVEYSDRLPLEIPVRKKIKKVIDIYVDFKKIDYPEVWNILDREVYNRLGFDIKTRKDNYRAKGIKKTRLDIYEDLGILEPVFDIASFIFRIDKDVA
jgi:hypothetical protein